MNTFTLKCIALLLMVLDHIGLYFPAAPIWFRWLGRMSCPLFLFCMVWGYHYTRNRKKYLLRLYIMSMFMACFGYFVNYRFSTPSADGYGYHNIFLSMLIVGILISVIEAAQKDLKKGMLLLGLVFGAQLLYFAVLTGIPAIRHNVKGDFVTAFIPNLALNEYGFEFIALGVLMYFLKEKKNMFCVMYLLFCIYQFSSEMFMIDMDWAMVLHTGWQFLMVLSLPLMLLYNRKKGPGMKYFFYFFYPAHTFALFYLAHLMNK